MLTIEKKLSTISKRNSKKVYTEDVVFLLTNKYGIQDLKDWIKLDYMLNFISKFDKELEPSITRYLKTSITNPYNKAGITDTYMLNLQVRLSLLEQIEELEEMEKCNKLIHNFKVKRGF